MKQEQILVPLNDLLDVLKFERDRHQKEGDDHCGMVKFYDARINLTIKKHTVKSPRLKVMMKTRPVVTTAKQSSVAKIVPKLPDYRMNMTLWQKFIRTYLFLGGDVTTIKIIKHIVANHETYEPGPWENFRKNFAGQSSAMQTNKCDFFFIKVGKSKGSNVLRIKPGVPMEALYKSLEEGDNPRQYIWEYTHPKK